MINTFLVEDVFLFAVFHVFAEFDEVVVHVVSLLDVFVPFVIHHAMDGHCATVSLIVHGAIVVLVGAVFAVVMAVVVTAVAAAVVAVAVVVAVTLVVTVVVVAFAVDNTLKHEEVMQHRPNYLHLMKYLN